MSVDYHFTIPLIPSNDFGEIIDLGGRRQALVNLIYLAHIASV
jgi:hypothetical protein